MHNQYARLLVSPVLITSLICSSALQYGCVEDVTNMGPDVGNGTDTKPELEVQNARTSAAGEAEFDLAMTGERIRVVVHDPAGRPLEDISLLAALDGNQLVIFAFDQSGRHFPALEVVEQNRPRTLREPMLAATTVVVIVLTVIGVASAVHEFATDPPRADVVAVGDGEVTRCLVGDWNDVVAILGITAAPLAGAAGGKIVAVKYGAEVGKIVEIVIGAGATAASALAKLSEYMDEDIQTNICWNEELIGPDGNPAYVEIGPIDGTDLLSAPAGLDTLLTATGQVAGHVAVLHVDNQTDQEKHVLVFPGISFRNETSSGRQDMTVIRTASATVPAGQQKMMAVSGACINLHKAPPSPGDLFVPFTEQRWDLIALGQAIDRLNADDIVAQLAVWAITDDVTPTDEEVIQLLIAAGLNPDDYGSPRSVSAGTQGAVQPEKLERMLLEQ